MLFNSAAEFRRSQPCRHSDAERNLDARPGAARADAHETRIAAADIRGDDFRRVADRLRATDIGLRRVGITERSERQSGGRRRWVGGRRRVAVDGDRRHDADVRRPPREVAVELPPVALPPALLAPT